MRKLLLIVVAVGIAIVALFLTRRGAAVPPPPTLPPKVLLAGIDAATATALLTTEQRLEQAYVAGDFDAYRRLTSDRLFTNTHNNEARTGNGFDRTTFKPRPTPKPEVGTAFEEGTLTAAARVGDTAALYYAVTREWPKTGMQAFPVTIKRFVIRQGAWVRDLDMCIARESLPTTAEEWLALKVDPIGAIDGKVYPGEPLLPPAAYPGQIGLNSDALTTVKINGEIVAQTTAEQFQKQEGIWSVANTMNAGLKKGQNSIEINTRPLETPPPAEGKKPLPPYGTEIKVTHYGPSGKSVEIYTKKIPAGQSATVNEVFLLEHPDEPAHPVTCQTCQESR